MFRQYNQRCNAIWFAMPRKWGEIEEKYDKNCLYWKFGSKGCNKQASRSSFVVNVPLNPFNFKLKPNVLLSILPIIPGLHSLCMDACRSSRFFPSILLRFLILQLTILNEEMYYAPCSSYDSPTLLALALTC